MNVNVDVDVDVSEGCEGMCEVNHILMEVITSIS